MELGVWSVFSFSIAAACGAPKRDFRGGHAGAGEGGDAGASPMETSGHGGSGHGGGAEAEAGAAPMGTSGRGGGVNADAGAGGIAGGASACTAGANRACYASADGAAYPGMPPANQTTCRLGQQKCEDGTWSSCVGAIGPEAVDTCEPGNDANCNGVPNEGCTCANGKTCSAGTACSSDGSGCKLADGQACATSTDCATSPCSVFNLDADNDGYRANGTPVKLCGTSRTGYVLATTNKGDDCNDSSVDIHPGAAEVCDGIDNDCDGKLDMLGNPTLKLSGTVKSIGLGTYSSVGSIGNTYGVVFTDSGSSSSSFEIIDQTATVKAGSKVALDSAGSYPLEPESDFYPGAGSLSPPAMTWDGKNLSIFFLLGYSDLYFRQATAEGLVNTPAIWVSSNAAGLDAFAQKTAAGNWLYHSWRSAFQTANIYYVPFNGSSGPQTSSYQPTGTLFTGMALSGTTFGIVNRNDALASPGIEFSTRDSSGNIITAATTVATNVGSQSRAAIAARTGGGFAIIYGDSGNLFYLERSVTNGAICGPIYMASANFLPVQLVPTSRGYLAVSAAGGTVKAQEISAGCTWGVSLPNIGPGADDSGYSTSKTHIAAGSGGFAMVWDYSGEIHARSFGPNFCD